MIVYNKLDEILEQKGMTWNDLCNAGLSANMPQKFKKNKALNTTTVDLVCEYLGVQPGDIMEYVPDGNVEERRKEFEKAKIKRQIAELQEKLKKYE